MTNPDVAQEAVPVKIAAVGYWMAEESFLIPPQVMQASREAIFGVPAGASPLKLVLPRFTTRAFGQTNPFADAPNSLRLHLTP